MDIVGKLDTLDNFAKSVKASELKAGDAVVWVRSLCPDTGKRSYRVWILTTDTEWNENRVRGVVGARVIEAKNFGATSWGGDSSDTEWFANEYVLVLTDAGRERFGVAPNRKTCPHPARQILNGYLPGRVMGGVWIDGMKFTECGRCGHRQYLANV